MRDLLKLCVEWYGYSGNVCGGNFHVVLDDDNTDDGNLEWSRQYMATDPNGELGTAILDGLQKFTQNQRQWVVCNIYNVTNGDGEREIREELEGERDEPAPIPDGNPRRIKISPIKSEIAVYTIFEDGKRCAYCMMAGMRVKKVNEIVLPGGATQTQVVGTMLHIWTDTHLIRKGYARDLLDAVKLTFDDVYVEPLTPDVKMLAMNTGFVKAKDGDLFRWVKQ